jgi:hypothetical protein
VRTIKDRAGRVWTIEEIGGGGPVSNAGSGSSPEVPLSTLRVTSGDQRFVVSIPTNWTELSDEEFWQRLEAAWHGNQSGGGGRE